MAQSRPSPELRKLQRLLDQERRQFQDEEKLVGKCMSMCPREEQLRRQEQNRLHPLERLPQNVQADNKGLPRVDPSQAVKEYSRPAGRTVLAFGHGSSTLNSSPSPVA
eukprot:TRINITY_DN8798_c0_g1_i2.p1 TRINITY_DN8798_c0_g1~~TRINITY_DN8798_c0_g1_i2.p1  ORF type:complete len:108 (+),score=17.46 TRINITY_DN8798_c0_g1_i2:2-325(+)